MQNRESQNLVLKFLSHPAWNGLSCFIAAIGAFGLGSVVLGFIVGFFRRLQDLVLFLFTPAQIPRIYLVGGLAVLVGLIATQVWRSLLSRSSRKSAAKPIDDARKPASAYQPSALDIAIMKQLAVEKESGPYWVAPSQISLAHHITENRVDYYLRILSAHGFVHQHLLHGGWGIQDEGIDFLIERELI